MLWLNLVAWLTVAVGASAAAQSKGVRLPRTSNGLQDIVTWDEYSLKIHGERIAIFSGEIHPYRMPVHSLYTDLFQKVKALGFNAVSFYTFWGLHEPKRGAGVDFSGFRDLRPFIEAAQAAGLYLIARPGPYINAETTGGGFPGWGARDPALWRTSNASYVEAYQDYLGSLSEIIAEYQITNGGPIILVQAENEYSGYQPPTTEDFQYERDVLNLFHSKGVIVPTTSNDAWTGGHYKMVDIYGYDSYPNGFDCANPYNWSSDAVPETFFNDHMNISPGAPNGIMEFQGGGFDGWGGPGFAGCALRLGPEFERVFYKNQFAQSTTILNLYMIFGGTNFGGISHPGGYSSYDYGAAIAEDRTLREKYYELKLQANFIKVTPTFATTRPQNIGKTAGAFTGNPALKVTQTLDVVGNKTGFYIVRQADAASYAVQNYKLTLPTSAGNITIPQLGGSLTLTGRDSKIHVVDYAAGSTELLYSTGEIATWATIDNRDVIVLYGNEGETHETAFKFSGKSFDTKIVSGTGEVTSKIISGNLVIKYSTDGLTVVKIGDTILAYILRRSDAYEFWSPNVPDVSAGKYANFNTKNPVLVKGGYLIRSVDIKSDTLQISGDLNSTTSLEIIAPAAVKKVVFNGLNLSAKRTPYGTLLVHKNAKTPAVTLPNLKALTWKSANSLPEIQADYDDLRWTVANHTTTVSPFQPLNTSVVLYASDYGYNTGNLLWRAHFVATGDETAFWPTIIGGSAFGYSIWLDQTFIGSFAGDATLDRHNQSYTLPKKLVHGQKHVITILQDHTGLEGDWWAAGDSFKTPRGILNYTFPGSPKTIVDTWKLTGNLGGENYVDRARGPLNEGGLYAERQGWHLPGFDDRKWAIARPTEGIKQPGVQFYRTTFELNVPSGTDYPMSFVFGNSSLISHYRTQLYVNGWQFGKYVNAMGPQTRFPVPQGVLNYKGTNTLAVSLWAHDKNGAKLDDFHMEIGARLESGLGQVVNLDAPGWTSRPLAY